MMVKPGKKFELSRGNCWDNAPQESFFGHMKDEIDLSVCETFDQVKAIIDDQIILADEPTASLDVENRERIVTLLFNMNKEFNATIIMIE